MCRYVSANRYNSLIIVFFYLLQPVDSKYISMLTSCNYFVDYIDAVLLDERSALTVDVIYEFLTTFFPKVPYV